MFTTKKLFWKKELQNVSWLSWVIKIIPIPVGIINSVLISEIVLEAVDGNLHSVLIGGAKLLGILLLTRIVTGVIEIIYGRKSSKVLHHCKMKLYEYFLNTPLMVLYKLQGGETKEKLNDDFVTITDRDLKVYPEFWTAVITAIFYLYFLLVQSPIIACVIGVISLIQVLPPIIVKRFMQVNYEATREIEADITDFIIEGIDGFATIKLYHLKDWWISKMEQMNKRYKKIGNRSIYAAEAEDAMKTLVTNILQYGTYGIIGLLVLYQCADLETGIQAIALSGSFFGAVKTIFSVIPRFAVSRVAEKRIQELCKVYPERTHMAEDNNIRLEKVSGGFEDKIIFKDFTAHWKSGEKIIMKGTNGTGKSTLMKTMLGLLPCSEGNIFIGGAASDNLSAENFPGRICYLPQQDLLLSVTAQELYKEVCPEKAEKIMEIAGFLGVGDETLHTVKINSLSGGECKKVYLALGIGINPAVLLLDEPTNSLDDIGKQRLNQLLKEYKGNLILITHENIFDNIADNIYCLEGGVLQSGNEA